MNRAEDKAAGYRATWVCRACGRHNEATWRWMVLTEEGNRLMAVCRCGEPYAFVKWPQSKKVLKKIVRVSEDEVPASRLIRPPSEVSP